MILIVSFWKLFRYGRSIQEGLLFRKILSITWNTFHDIHLSGLQFLRRGFSKANNAYKRETFNLHLKLWSSACWKKCLRKSKIMIEEKILNYIFIISKKIIYRSIRSCALGFQDPLIILENCSRGRIINFLNLK